MKETRNVILLGYLFSAKKNTSYLLFAPAFDDDSKSGKGFEMSTMVSGEGAKWQTFWEMNGKLHQKIVPAEIIYKRMGNQLMVQDILFDPKTIA